MRTLLYCLAVAVGPTAASAQLASSNASLYVDFHHEQKGLRLFHGATQTAAGLEFTTALQFAELENHPALHGIKAMTLGGWFYPRRSGEQYFFFRGLPEIAPLGERLFRPRHQWVNFVLGSDQHGFFLGTINGNGSMPFAFVTLNEIPIDAWSQLVVVKAADGFQKFYQNGTLICTDREAAAGGQVWPFSETAAGEPVRFAMPMGGILGEAWIFPRELSAEEIKIDFLAKRERYKPALAGVPVAVREMNAHPAAGLWKEEINNSNWPQVRERILGGAMKVLGPFPTEKVQLNPKIISEEDGGSYVRRKISIQVQPEDRMPFYLLVPKKLLARAPKAADRRNSKQAATDRAPAILCFYGTTSGAGKETTVGLSGPKPGTPPAKNRAFAVDMVEAGFVALAADYLRDGERLKPGQAPYDTTDFYKRFPNWSIHGKDIWDNARVIDYLHTLDFIDTNKIGMVGHSYGGHSTIFTTALEPRIKVAFANGPVSDFLHHGMHWGVAPGARNSQSLPSMRPYVLDHTLPLPVTFYEFTALIAPRPLCVGQAVGERRPMEEENYAAVRRVYESLGVSDRVRYMWYPGDHDFAPHVRREAVAWFKHWFGVSQ